MYTQESFSGALTVQCRVWWRGRKRQTPERRSRRWLWLKNETKSSKIRTLNLTNVRTTGLTTGPPRCHYIWIQFISPPSSGLTCSDGDFLRNHTPAEHSQARTQAVSQRAAHSHAKWILVWIWKGDMTQWGFFPPHVLTHPWHDFITIEFKAKHGASSFWCYAASKFKMDLELLPTWSAFKSRLKIISPPYLWAFLEFFFQNHVLAL